MRRPALLLTAVCVALGALAPAASAAPRIGVADNDPRIFSDPLYLALESRYTRVVVAWDAVLTNRAGERDALDQYFAGAAARGIEPLVVFNYSRGHRLGDTRDLPRVSAYASAFRAFRQRYPSVRLFSPWNEVNHFSQPTYRNPRRAAQFTNHVARNCEGCKVVAGDFLDQRGMTRYVRRFKRHLKVRAKIWGLHNYSDTNRYRARGTRSFLRVTRRGEVWLTETGGVVKFGRSFPYSPSRAAKATRYMLRLASSNRRIKRLYVYNFYGVPKSARFDSGLVGPDGKPRPAYHVVRKALVG